MEKGLQKRHAVWNALSILLALSLIMGLVPQLTQKAEAAPSGTGYLSVGSKINYDSYNTHYMYVDGNVAYCAQPNMATPPEGTYTKEPCTTRPSPYDGRIHEVQEIYAILYFGYGGPGFDPAMWPAYYNGGTWTPELYQAMTHVFLSDVFAYNADAALTGCSAGFKTWAWKNIIGWDQANSQSVYSSWGWKVFERRWEVPKEFCDSCFQMTTGSNTQVIVSFVPGGYVDLQKASSNTDITNNHPCYSLENAEYGIYSDAGCTSLIETLTTNASGYAKSGLINTGTVYVKETRAPKGYALDTKVYPVSVGSGSTTRVNGDKVYDLPQNDPAAMWVGKIDLETTLNMPQGSASLAGAEFTVRYYNNLYDSVSAAEASGKPTRTWVVRTNENGYAQLDDTFKVSGDRLYYDSAGQVTIPLGTVLIQETKAPKGYFLTDSAIHLRKIESEGIVEDVTSFNPPIVKEQVYRGDMEFVKSKGFTQERLGNVPFRVTSLGTGESHIVVTDANGEMKTAASWNAHTTKTNANDAAVNADGTVDESKLDPYAGVWFYGVNDQSVWPKLTVNNSKGALPYDDYKIEELRCKANEGLVLVSIDVHITRDAYSVDLGTIDNQREDQGPAIHTVARNTITGLKSAAADTATKLTDRVNYTNVDTTGKAYELRATLMDTTTGEAVTDSAGNAVTGSARFVPTASNGYADVQLAFDSRAYANRDVVFFEELYVDGGTEPVTEHKDLTDFDQTIRIMGQSIATKATDAVDGDKQVSCDPESSVKDTVRYKNLLPGVQYTMTATLMLRNIEQNAEGTTIEAEPYTDADGDPYTASVTFTPEYADGEIDVVFAAIDTTDIVNRSLVVYEVLTRDGEIIASHEDAYDEDQSVTIHAPEIGTKATDAVDGDSVLAADRTARLIDTVEHKGLIPGKEYTLIGTLMVKDHEVKDDGTKVTTAHPLLDQDGNAITAETTFTPETSDGHATVEFVFDASNIADDAELVVYERLLRVATEIATHEDPADPDQSFTVRKPQVETELIDARTNTHEVTADSEASLVDTIEYTDCVVGAAYTAYGILLDPQTGTPVLQYAEDGSFQATDEAIKLADELAHALGVVVEDAEGASVADLLATDNLAPYPHGVDVELAAELLESDIAKRFVIAKEHFTCENTFDRTTLEYALDARGLEGTSAVSCMLLVREDPFEAVAGEFDLTAESQTITFVAPSIETQASDATDGDKNLLVSTEARIADEVAYKGLIPGKEYTLEGVLYDKATGKPLKVHDKLVSATHTFTPNSAEGTETVEFTFDASALNGHELVVYEYLYRGMVTDGESGEKVKVAEHADITSEPQTVGIGHTPGTPYAKTGQDMNIFALIVGLLVAGAACIGTYAWYFRGVRADDADGEEAESQTQ